MTDYTESMQNSMQSFTVPENSRLILSDSLSIADETAAPYVVEGIFPQVGVAELYATRGTGKTFIMQDICNCIAAGIPWNGRKTIKSPVLYINLEAGASLVNRNAAWTKFHDMPMPYIQYIRNSFKIMDHLDILAIGTPQHSVVVIDTLHRAIHRTMSEQSNDDMGIVMDHLRQFAERTQSLIIFIHHDSKSGSQGRGASCLGDDADAVICITRKMGADKKPCISENGQPIYRLTSDRLKEMPDFSMEFCLTPVVIGIQPDGEIISSCVPTYLAVECDTDASPNTVITANNQLAVKLLVEMASTDGIVLLSDWSDAYAAAFTAMKPSNKSGPKMAISRAKDFLQKTGIARIDNGTITILQPVTAVTTNVDLTVTNAELNDTTEKNVHTEKSDSVTVSNNPVLPSKMANTIPTVTTVTKFVNEKQHSDASVVQWSTGGNTPYTSEMYIGECYSPDTPPCTTLTEAVTTDGCLEGGEGSTTTATAESTDLPGTTTTVASQPTAPQDEPRPVPLPPSRQHPHAQPATPPDRSNSNAGAAASGVAVAEIPPDVAAQIQPAVTIFHAKITKIKRTTPAEPHQQPAPQPRQKSLIPPSNIPTGYQEGAA